MIDYVALAVSRYAQFSGRSRRSEYWYSVLAYAIVAISSVFIFSTIALRIGGDTLSTVVAILPTIIIFVITVPMLAVLVRRLHDTGRSGWWIMLRIIPVIGSLILLVWLITDGDPEPNKYGPNPKTSTSDDDVSAHLID